MEINKDLSQLVYDSINILKNSFGEINVKLLSKKIIKTTPTEDAPICRLGVFIEIIGVKTFLDYTTMENLVYNPNGQLISNEFALMIIKSIYHDKI